MPDEVDILKNGKCELCGREDSYLNFHHLIPKTLHNNKYFLKNYSKNYMRTHGLWICKRECHKMIHTFIEEKELGLNFNTKEKLLENKKVKNYINWRIKH